jgi:hypothetical protein
MEARPVRICVSVTFVNIRFDSNTLAPPHHRTYVGVDHPWNQPIQGVSV